MTTTPITFSYWVRSSLFDEPGGVAAAAPLQAAITAAGAGKTVKTGVVGLDENGKLTVLLVFDTSVSPRAWYSHVVSGTRVWEPVEDAGDPTGPLTTKDGKAAAGSLYGAKEAVIALSDNVETYYTVEAAATLEGMPPAQINDLAWEVGQLGVYIAAADDGVLKSLDKGATWGYVLPFPALGTVWPAGAVGRAIGFMGKASGIVPGPLYLIDTSSPNKMYRLQSDDVTFIQQATALSGTARNVRYFNNGRLGYAETSGGLGVLRWSTDYGRTFTTLTSPTAGDYLVDFSYTPAPGSRLYAVFERASRSRIYSSDNDGVSWTLRYGPSASSKLIANIECHPWRTTHIVCHKLRESSNEQCVLVSTNSGSTWAEIVSSAPIADVGSRTYWSVNDRLIDMLCFSTGIQLNYANSPWTSWTTGLSSTPDGPGHMLQCGAFSSYVLVAMFGNDHLFRSLNGGVSWTAFAEPSGFGSNQAIIYDLLTDRLYLSSTSGAFRTWYCPDFSITDPASPVWVGVSATVEAVDRGLVVIGDQPV